MGEAAELSYLGAPGDGNNGGNNDDCIDGRGGNVEVEEVLACAFDRWYDSFKHVTFKSRVLLLSEDVVQYLQSDGIFVPTGTAPESTQLRNANEDSDSEWGDGGSNSEGSHGNEPSFPELESAMCTAIEELGGAVLPKLNWSAPKDAQWIFGTLRCETVQEIFTLLKASDFVAHDLCHSFDLCANGGGGKKRPDAFYLVLRTWHSVDESHEFRCFVSGRRLCAVSQRHHSLFFPHLTDETFAEPVRQSIITFFETHVRDGFSQDKYVFDVLVGKTPRLKVKLVDFSPWGPSTDPLLFDWNELRALGNGVVVDTALCPEFRVVRSEAEKRAKLENYHSLPVEVAQLGAYSPEQMEELCRKAEEFVTRNDHHTTQS